MNAVEPSAASCDFCHLPVPSSRAGGEGPLYCCYGCKLAAEITRSRGESGQVNWMLTRLGVSVFLSMIVMMFSMYLYRQQFVDREATTALSSELAGVMRYLCLLFSAPVVFMLGWPVMSSAIEGIKARRYSTDALVVLGVAAAVVYSYVSTLRDRGEVYYETACVVLVFMTLGRWLEANGKLKASAAVAGLESFFPDQVTIERDGEELAVRPQEVLVGDLLVIPAGQRVAADSRIEFGRSEVDESILTGESAPVVREPGDLLRAGTLNTDGLLRARAVSVGQNSTLGRLMALLEEAKRTRSRWERLTDRISRGFIPITLILAVVGFGLGLARGHLDRAIMTSLSVMLIACPCALGIATPMAVWVALGAAARRGILFRNGETLEGLARIRAICFDKTGTITNGTPAVKALDVALFADERQVASLAAAAASASRHALADGIIAWGRRSGGPAIALDEARTIPGRGIVARVGDRCVALGSVALMREQGLGMDDSLQARILGVQLAGQSLACIGWNGEVQGVFEFSESLRSEAKSSLAELKSLGLAVRVLTGDHPARATVIARELDVETRGRLSPDEKVSEIRDLRRSSGAIAMVGDGLNDAPALAAADVGIAMGCGADLTREHGSICLLGNNLAEIPWMIELARQTVHTIKVNLFWAFAYNLVGIGLALAGRLNPIFAAAAMIVSSLMVVGNSLRLNQVGAKATTRANRDSETVPGRMELASHKKAMA